jgi:hypothetical protein
MIPRTLHLSSLIALVWGASSLSVVYLFAACAGSHSWYASVNQLGPALTLLGCLGVASSLVHHNSVAVWSPVPWFLIACAAYYGFGPLSYYYATPETVDFMQLDFPLDERQILFTNLLNSIGIGAVGLGVIVMEHVFLPHHAKSQSIDSNRETALALWLFLITGAFVKYFFTLPHALGLLSYVLPGSIQHVAGLLNGAVILSIRLVRQGRRHYRWVLYPLVVSECVSGLMTFSKTEVLTTALSVVLGLFLCRQSVRLLVASGIAGVVLYVTVLAPFVIFARNNFSSFGVSEVADLQTTVAAYSHVGSEVQALTMPDVQIWWARLNYAPDQGFAMDAYERGTIGQTVNLLPYIFVPRLFFPEKPSMNSGREFTELLTAQEATSSTALGLFGEAYWNGGWMLVLAVCVYVGMLFSVLARFSAQIISGERFLFIPIVFSGIMTGLYPDGWVVSTFFGGVLEIIVLYFILSIIRLWSIARPMPGRQLTSTA